VMSSYVSGYRKVGAPWGEARLVPIQILLSQFTTVVDWSIARSLAIGRNGHILGLSSGPHMIDGSMPTTRYALDMRFGSDRLGTCSI